jgi:hypothetical protein
MTSSGRLLFALQPHDLLEQRTVASFGDVDARLQLAEALGLRVVAAERRQRRAAGARAVGASIRHQLVVSGRHGRVAIVANLRQGAEL